MTEGDEMLDLSHPKTEHIFLASSLIEKVKAMGQRMSVSPSTVRAALLADSLPLFAEMRDLALSRFAESTGFILAAVDEYEAAIRELAGLNGGQITEDRRDGTGRCPVCGTAITHYKKYRTMLCGECDKPFMAAYEKLESSEGFCTWAI
jgi:hypothetical protein